jgi:hypothetical protein
MDSKGTSVVIVIEPLSSHASAHTLGLTAMPLPKGTPGSLTYTTPFARSTPVTSTK